MPDQSAQQLSAATAPPREYNATVEAMLLDLFPHKLLMDAAASFLSVKERKSESATTLQFNADVEAQRNRLLALPEVELQAQYARLQKKKEIQRIAAAAKVKADKEAKAAEKEAAKFYNQPNAEVDFAFWAKMDYWTREESIALLLGKNPKVVTTAAMKREMEPRLEALLFPNKLAPQPEFIQQYQRLWMLAERAEALKPPRLKPPAVMAWAQRTEAFDLPPLLAQLFLQPETLHPAKKEETQPTAVPNAPTVGTLKKWTSDKLTDLATYRDQHGTQAAATKFGISDARVRQLLPKVSIEKPTGLSTLQTAWPRR